MSDPLHTDVKSRQRTASEAAKAGDTARARALYVAMATDNPGNKQIIGEVADALAALGHLEEAIEILQTALNRFDGSPALSAILVKILTTAERWSDATDILRRQLARAPNIGIALELGHVLVMSDALDEAEAVLQPIVTNHPAIAAAHIYYCGLLFKRRRMADALAAADRAITLEHNNAAAHRSRGTVLMELNQLAQASEAFRRALAIKPGNIDTLIGLGTAEARQENYAAAVAHMRHVLELNPAHAVAQHLVATWAGEAVTQGSPIYTRKLFDGYAPAFDHSLQKDLGYRVPEDAAALLRTIMPSRDQFRSLLDLGCGTGLGAAALAYSYDIPRRVGIDISPKMLAIAEKKRLYTQLVEGEIDRAVNSVEGDFDLMVSFDVFIYVGRLETFFAAVAPRLVQGGVLAYSIETDSVEDVKLMRSGRFAHTQAYIDRLATQNGLTPRIGKSVVVRMENGKPLPGYIGILVRK